MSGDARGSAPRFKLDYSRFDYRPATMDDAELMLDWRSQAHVREGMFTSRLFTLDEHRAWLERTIAAEDRIYHLFLMDGAPLGVFGFYNMDRLHGRAEWAFYMGPNRDRSIQGLGAAMEFIAVDTFFRETGLNKLWGQVLHTNPRVARMHITFGFRIEGVQRAHFFKDDQFLDAFIVALLADEWRDMRQKRWDQIFGRSA